MPIDHTALNIPMAKFQDCLKVYLAALKPLGYEQRVSFGPTNVGMGSTEGPTREYTNPIMKATDFWLIGVKEESVPTTHFAFSTKDRAAIDAFHKAAIEAGAKDNGAPGIREHYHPNYYAAFFIDPAGNNVEAVCHDAQ